jgi:hypothetical protein
MDNSSGSSSSSSFSCLCLLLLLYVFPALIPHEGAKQFIVKYKTHRGGSDTSSDFSLSDISD